MHPYTERDGDVRLYRVLAERLTTKKISTKLRVTEKKQETKN